MELQAGHNLRAWGQILPGHGVLPGDPPEPGDDTLTFDSEALTFDSDPITFNAGA